MWAAFLFHGLYINLLHFCIASIILCMIVIIVSSSMLSIPSKAVPLPTTMKNLNVSCLCLHLICTLHTTGWEIPVLLYVFSITSQSIL